MSLQLVTADTEPYNGFLIAIFGDPWHPSDPQRQKPMKQLHIIRPPTNHPFQRVLIRHEAWFCGESTVGGRGSVVYWEIRRKTTCHHDTVEMITHTHHPFQRPDPRTLYASFYWFFRGGCRGLGKHISLIERCFGIIAGPTQSVFRSLHNNRCTCDKFGDQSFW